MVHRVTLENEQRPHHATFNDFAPKLWLPSTDVSDCSAQNASNEDEQLGIVLFNSRPARHGFGKVGGEEDHQDLQFRKFAQAVSRS